MTYHRHLNHEILLITQNKSLINTIYRNIPEIFIKALPRSKAISQNTLRYFHYTEYRMTNKFSTSEIIVNDTYFDVSGNKSNQKLVGKKFIYMFIVFVSFLILAFSLFFYKMMFTSNSPEIKKENEIVAPINNDVVHNEETTKIEKDTNFINVPDTVSDMSDYKYMQLICTQKYNYCLYKTHRINLRTYLTFKATQKFKEYSLTKIDNDYFILDVFVSEYFYSLYNTSEVRKNEKINITDITPDINNSK